MVILATVEDAIQHLDLLRTRPNLADTNLRFAGELSAIRLYFNGPEFHRSLTGELMRGLGTYQEEIFRAARFALYGENSRTQLSSEQRKAFEIVFEVDEGSTDLTASIEKIAEGLAAGVAGMDPTTLAIVIVLVVLILVSGHVVSKIFDGIQATKQKQVEESGRGEQLSAMVALSQHAMSQQTAVAEILQSTRNMSVVKHFDAAQEAGAREVLKSVPQATEARINGVSFDSEDIQELRRRSPRSRSEHMVVQDEFRVFADTSLSPIRLTLSGKKLPGEFDASFPDELSPEQEEELWSAIKKKGTILLEVDATVIRDTVRSAVVVDVLSEARV